jgi:hypothetical protein
MQVPSAVPQTTRRLWEIQRADGFTFRCDLEPTSRGYMAWFKVNGQAIGAHSFDAQLPATEWAQTLLRQCDLTAG